MKLGEPKVVDEKPMRVAGLSGEYTRAQTGEIPRQWEQFNSQLGYASEARVDDFTLGVIFPMAVMRYVTGVEIKAEAAVPEDWVEVEVPAQRYAIFAETGGIPAIRAAWVAIFSEWLPQSGMEQAAGPMLERYPESWMESGDFEIWIPVAG